MEKATARVKRPLYCSGELYHILETEWLFCSVQSKLRRGLHVVTNQQWLFNLEAYLLNVLATRMVIVTIPIKAQTMKIDLPAAVLGEKSPVPIVALFSEIGAGERDPHTVS